MSASSTFFKQLIPALAELSDATVDFWISQATLLVSAVEFGSLYTQACCYLAAHLYVVGTGVGVDGTSADAAGPIASQSTGSVSIAYAGASAMADAGAYGSTRYGRQFVQIRRKRIITARTL